MNTITKKQLCLKLFLILAFSIYAANAVELKNFYGSWSGTRKETTNGIGQYCKIRIQGEERVDGGLILVEKGNWPTFGAYTWKHNFHKSGKYSSIATSSYGFILASTSGTWKKSNGSIWVVGKNSNLNGTSKFAGTLKLVTKNKISYTGNSGGTRLMLIGNRK